MSHALLTAFGLFAVAAMIICYELEARSPRYILGFAVACWLGAVYGFLQGAWPFGIAEVFWGAIAIKKWRGAKPVVRGNGAGTA